MQNISSCSYHPFRLVLIACFALGLLGYAPAITPANVALADPPPPPPEGKTMEEAMAHQPALDTQQPSPTPSAEAWRADEEAELRAGLAALELARQDGPEAVVALLNTLRGEALDIAMDEIVAAHRQLVRSAPPRPAIPAPSPAEEEAMLQAQAALDAASRVRALAYHDDPAEGRSLIPDSQPQTIVPTAPMADRTVGNGCTYTTIAAAIADSNPGDRLLIEGGVNFVENLVIPISLTLQGGYDGCTSGSSARTTIDGGGSDRVIEINNNLEITLENLNITNGAASWGGGIRAYNNTDLWGTNLRIYNNTATSYGGGLRLWGARATFSDTNIYNNIAPIGAGVYGTLYVTADSDPELHLAFSADVYDNQALTSSGFGGGVYMREGIVSLTDSSDILSNDAIEGGGAYLVTSTLTIEGSLSEIYFNTATGNGGGVYAVDSTVNMDLDAELYDNTAGYGGGLGFGGGAYLDNSNLWSDKASIHFNTANNGGGGVYATNGSLLDMDLGGYTCTGPRCSQLSNNTAINHSGGGVYASGSMVDLRQTFVETNTASSAGAVFAYDYSTIYAYNDLFTGNDSASVGDGISLYRADLIGSENTLAYNPADGSGSAIFIDEIPSNVTLERSIVWGHATSISELGHTVTCSDIQGGYTGTDNMDIDPLFVDPGSADFHLQSVSPVIDRCTGGLSVDFDNEPRPIAYVRPATPYDMGADEAKARVGINGGGCNYGSIQQAVNAATGNDTIQAVATVYTETVDIAGSIAITIAGGYDDDCTTYITDTTTIDGSASSGSVFDITDSQVVLRNLNITGGDAGNGGGMRVLGDSQVTLDNTDVFGNNAGNGGGIYLNPGCTVTITNDSDIYQNTALSNGGGARVWGKLVGNDWHSTISNNTAPDGGGVSVPGGVLELHSSHVMNNQATDAASRGGGIHVYGSGVVTATSSSNVAYNDAYDGAGIYADDASVYLSAVVHSNIATNDGGGVYLSNDSALRTTGAHIGYSAAGWGDNEAIRGAGIYAITSTVDLDGRIVNNIALTNGGGIYADNSTINLTDTQVGGTNAHEANQLSGSATYGGGLYLTNGTQATLNNTTVSSNTFPATGTVTYGGGAYVTTGSILTLTNSTIERHLAPSIGDGRGAGVYLNYATLTLNNSWVISNTAGTVGGGVRMWGTSTLNVLNSSELSNNQALNGGGGAIAATGLPTITISNSALQYNSANTDGGAVYLDAGILAATNCTFRDGQAAENGGAIAAYASTLTIDADYTACDPLSDQCSAFYSNTADSDANNSGDGGAIYANDSILQMNHTYLHRNSAYYGGAIFQDGASASAQVNNSLIYSNTTTYGTGAGIRADGGSFTMTHVTLANNVNGAAYSQPTTGVSSAALNSIAWGNDLGFHHTFVITSCNIDQDGNVGIAVDPQFVSPGPGEDYHLSGISPAIDACAAGLSPDLDNVSRPFGGGYDMGAYEYAYGVEFAPDHSGSGLSPGVIMYTHALTNTGGSGDTFIITAQSDQGWPVAIIPMPLVTLGSGISTPITVSLNIPAGVLSGTVNTTVVTATSTDDPYLTARVTETTTVFTTTLPTYTLTVNVVGNGSVTRSPSQTTYISGTVVELTAEPDAGWGFDSWSGALTGNTNPDSITMDGDKEVTATFTVGSVCTEVTEVSLVYTNAGTIYTDTVVYFSADIAPDDADKPYTYTVDYGSGPGTPASSSDDPLTFDYTFVTTGTRTVEIAVWNCKMTSAVTDDLSFTVQEQGVCVDLDSIAIGGATSGTPGTYTFTTSYEPLDASIPITYAWDNDDTTATSVRALDVGTTTLTVTATNICATVTVTDTHEIVISSVGYDIYLPLVMRNYGP